MASELVTYPNFYLILTLFSSGTERLNQYVVEILNEFSNLGKAEIWSTRSEISLDVNNFQDSVTSLLCNI